MSEPCNNINVAEVTIHSLKGMTLFVEDEPKGSTKDKDNHRLDTGGCIRSTAIYVPEKHDKSKALNVVLWLHGQHVKDYQKNIFGPDTQGGESNLRESIDAAGKDVVLIVPFLGHSEGDSQPLTLPDPDGKGLEGYLAKLLSIDDVTDHLGKGPVGTLVLACHSAGGNMMRQATNRLGSLDKQLKECWGFDCMYADGQLYACWAASLPGKYLYFYQGKGSNAGHFWEFWDWAYGTPKNLRAPRMDNVFLAPGAQSTPANKQFQASVAIDGLVDDAVFKHQDVIAQMPKNLRSDYDEYRSELDQLLDRPTDWVDRVKATVYRHYDVVQHLFGPRVARLFDAKSTLGAGVIARCKAGKPASPPPPPPPPHTRRHKQLSDGKSK